MDFSEGFIVSCVKSWFINCTGSISFGSSGNEMSKELSLESVRELPNDCDSWSWPVRRSSAESTRESAGECGWRLTVLSNGVCCGNWTTVSPGCIDQGSLTILGWNSGKSGHSKDCTRRWCGACLLEARVYSLCSSTRWGNNWCIRVAYYSWCGQVFCL